jgi:putative membrane protein
MKHQGLVVLACAVALTVGCNSRARTDTNTIGTSGTSATSATRNNNDAVSNGDKDFVNKQMSDGMAEVEIAKLAKERAVNPEVKQFAQMMIDDHTNAGKLLTQVANTYAIPQHPAIDDKHTSLRDKLSKLSGAEFDKEYIDAMVDDHEDAVRDLRSRVDENRSLTDRLQGKNPEDRSSVKPEVSDDKAKASVNEWAANILPTVEHHLDRAKAIKEHIDHPNATAHVNQDTKGTKRY